MKKITVLLSEKANQQLNEILYSLPKNNDGSGLCTQSAAINYCLESMKDFEDQMMIDILTFLQDESSKVK